MGNIENNNLEKPENKLNNQVFLDQNFSGIIKEGSDNNGFNYFKQVFSSLPQDIQDLFNDKSNTESLKKYIEVKGFPITGNINGNFKKEYYEEYINNFYIFQDTGLTQKNTQEEQIHSKEEQIHSKEEQIHSKEEQEFIAENIKEFRSFYNSILPESTKIKLLNSEYDAKTFFDYVYTIGGKEKLSSDDLNGILSKLKNGNTLEKVLKALQDLDKQNGGKSKLYESFKSFAIGLDPSIATRIETYEKLQKIKDFNVKTLGYKRAFETGASLPNDTITKEKGGTVMKSKDEQSGKEIEVDLSRQPPSRYIVSSNGYKLEMKNLDDIKGSKFDFYNEKGVYSETIKFEEANYEYQTKTDNLNKGLQNIDFYEKEYKDADNLQDRKSVIKALKNNLSQVMGTMYNELGLDQINSIFEIGGGSFAEIKSKIQTKREELEKKFESVKKGYNNFIYEMTKEYRSKFEVNDKKSKETVKFIEDAGFDLIPQSLTDTIIRQYNVGKSENMQIDLKNGKFGVDPLLGKTDEITLSEKQSFISFFNKMISGKEQFGENIGPIIIGGGGNLLLKDNNQKPNSQNLQAHFDNIKTGNIFDNIKVLKNLGISIDKN